MLYIPIEIVHLKDLRRYKQRHEALLDYYYEHFSYFQNERAKRFSKIKNVLMEASEIFSFESWHRIFDLKFVNNPLSSRGSILNDPGGRFNIGDIDELKFARFPALYIAENFEVAYRERNQVQPSYTTEGLTADELSLTNKGSTVDLLLEGSIKSVIDLTKKQNLNAFYEIIKEIKLPKFLEKKSKQLNIPVMYHVKSLEELRLSILKDNWREMPMQVDIPANSQIFGQLAYASGIEGIVYPSKMSSKKKCLAVFTENFKNSSSYVKIQDGDLTDNIAYHELNSETYHYLF